MLRQHERRENKVREHRDAARTTRPDPVPARAPRSATDVVTLQRTIGNHATGALLQRTLILDGRQRDKAEEVRADLGNDFDAMRDTVDGLISVPGPPVKLSTAAALKQVHACVTTGTRPIDREAVLATIQLISHGAWARAGTAGIRAAFAILNDPRVMANLAELGDFLRDNPNVVENLKAAGVRWELFSTHQSIGAFGGGAVIDERIHIANSVLTAKKGFTKMAIHEAGHATFQRMLITGEKWTDEANYGNEPPDDKALAADGRKFYEAWQVLRSKPQYFYVTDMPGTEAAATGAGRQNYLAAQFTEFCADSFMHMALKKHALLAHVAKLPDTEADVQAAWRSALSVLLKYEDRMLGENTGAGAAAIVGHKSNLRFMAVVEELKAALTGPELEVANVDDARKHLISLREAWNGLTPEAQARHRSTALTTLDQYIMKVQRRRPAQSNLASELNFPGL